MPRKTLTIGALVRCTVLIVLCLFGPLTTPAHALPALRSVTPAARSWTPPARGGYGLIFGALIRGFSNWLVVWV